MLTLFFLHESKTTKFKGHCPFCIIFFPYRVKD